MLQEMFDMDMYSCLDLNSQYTVKPKCIEIRCKIMTINGRDLRWWGICGKRDIMRKWWIIPAIRQLLFRIAHMIFLNSFMSRQYGLPRTHWDKCFIKIEIKIETTPFYYILLDKTFVCLPCFFSVDYGYGKVSWITVIKHQVVRSNKCCVFSYN